MTHAKVKELIKEATEAFATIIKEHSHKTRQIFMPTVEWSEMYTLEVVLADGRHLFSDLKQISHVTSGIAGEEGGAKEAGGTNATLHMTDGTEYVTAETYDQLSGRLIERRMKVISGIYEATQREQGK